MKLNILKQASLPDALTAELARRYHLVELAVPTDASFRTLVGILTVLITNDEATVTRELIANLPALELIAVFGVGYDGMDVQAAAEHQVRVSHAPGVLTSDIADLALGLMLAVLQQVVAAHKLIGAGKQAAGGFPWTQGASGLQVGVMGTGRIGQAVARRYEGLTMQIAYHSRKRLPALNYAWRENLLTLVTESDFLVICTPGVAVDQGLINQPVLTTLEEKGILISISRGSVIDEPALAAALGSEIIAKVGSDVFSHEPAVPAGLLQRSNVIVTSHMASATWSTRATMAQLMLGNIVCWAKKKALVTPAAESLVD